MPAGGNLPKSLLATGPDGPNQVFFLTTVQPRLWITNVQPGSPLDDPWISIPPFGVQGAIDSMRVLPVSRRILITTTKGLWWASIPPAGMGSYVWTQADNDSCSGMAAASSEAVAVVKPGKGLSLGTWTQSALQMQGPLPIANYDNGSTGIGVVASSTDGSTLYAAVTKAPQNTPPSMRFCPPRTVANHGRWCPTQRW